MCENHTSSTKLWFLRLAARTDARLASYVGSSPTGTTKQIKTLVKECRMSLNHATRFLEQRGISSAGRAVAVALQAIGREFEPPILHQIQCTGDVRG